MRTYGRVPNGSGGTRWVEVTTDANGFEDMVWLTTLIQTLKLNLGESPFFANYGIPAHPSVVQQVSPDYYMAYTQQRFAPYFASLIIARIAPVPNGDPVYSVNVTTHQGVKLNASVPIPI